MKNLHIVAFLSSLMLGSSCHAGAHERARCQKTIGDEKAHDIFATLMHGRPVEILTVCGSYKGGDGKGGEARGNLFNWYFIRSLAIRPDEAIKVYIHQPSPNTLQLGEGVLIRFAYSDKAINIKDTLMLTTKVATKSVVLTYIDGQGRVREKELSESDVSL